MDMLKWAEKEIEIACKKENPDRKEGEFDYGCACYESALKAFKSLCEDGHSGFSIGLTKNILMRLIDGNPLTPIDESDKWINCSSNRDKYETYQCARIGSLFKYIYPDGSIEYKDINRYYCVDIDTGSTYTNGLVANVLNDMYPITLPYMPSTTKIVVYCQTFLVNPKNGDFDTKGILYLEKPGENGMERVDINRFFREPEENEEPTYHSWLEISKEEYDKRYKNQYVKSEVE